MVIRIVCSAIKHKDGAVIVGIRHYDSIMHETIGLRKKINPEEDWVACDQGFVDKMGNFLSRKEAWVIAVNAKQIVRFVGNQVEDDVNRTDVSLYSENLY
jgi:hypothetical protein